MLQIIMYNTCNDVYWFIDYTFYRHQRFKHTNTCNDVCTHTHQNTHAYIMSEGNEKVCEKIMVFKKKISKNRQLKSEEA